MNHRGLVAVAYLQVYAVDQLQSFLLPLSSLFLQQFYDVNVVGSRDGCGTVGGSRMC